MVLTVRGVQQMELRRGLILEQSMASHVQSAVLGCSLPCMAAGTQLSWAESARAQPSSFLPLQLLPLELPPLQQRPCGTQRPQRLLLLHATPVWAAQGVVCIYLGCAAETTVVIWQQWADAVGMQGGALRSDVVPSEIKQDINGVPGRGADQASVRSMCSS
jgi:hypothetical protein